MLLGSLATDFQEFPEAPPPGLVTIPIDEKIPDGFYLKSGYRAAGARALRVDMAERLADMLRVQNSRGGFEANSDMLSITGMTLEQFANLMKGLGYNSEKGERIKAKVGSSTGSFGPVENELFEENTSTEKNSDQSQPTGEITHSIETGEKDKSYAKTAEERVDAGSDESKVEALLEHSDEKEVFYTFTWAARQQKRNMEAKQKTVKKIFKVKGKGPKGEASQSHHEKKRTKTFKPSFSKKDKAIDPDNPFAAALKGFNKN